MKIIDMIEYRKQIKEIDNDIHKLENDITNIISAISYLSDVKDEIWTELQNLYHEREQLWNRRC